MYIHMYVCTYMYIYSTQFFKTTYSTTIFEQVLSTIYIFAFIKCLLYVLIHAWHRVSLIALVPGSATEISPAKSDFQTAENVVV